jgi:hypothetical protein
MEFQGNLGYIGRPCLKNKTKQKPLKAGCGPALPVPMGSAVTVSLSSRIIQQLVNGIITPATIPNLGLGPW